MKHLILAKFNPDVTTERKAAMLPEIQALFDQTLAIEGITAIRVLPNCVARDNRYDLMIEMTMTPEALPVYDACAAHKEWKKVYGDLLEKKCIFDYMD